MKAIILCFFALSCFSGFAQYFPKSQIRNIIERRFVEPYEINQYKPVHIDSYVLRKSIHDYFADKDSKLAKKGALLAFTIPKDKAASVAINAGLIYSFNKAVVIEESVKYLIKESDKYKIKDMSRPSVKYIKMSVSPYLQFDKNTLIDSEQENFLGGISYVNNIVNYEQFRNNYADKKRFTIPIKTTLSYRKDFESDLEAFQSSLVFSPQLFEINDKKELTRANWLGDKSIMDFDLKLGVEYDYRFNATEESLDGNMFRTYTQAKAQLKISERFVTSLDWQYRYVLANSTMLNNNDFSLLTFKIDYKLKFRSDQNLLESIEPTIGIIHENGENPTNGFNDQSYWALNLAIKI